MVLPCEDTVLRAAATQRPNYPIKRDQYLMPRVEKELTKLLMMEVMLNFRSEQLKRSLE